MRVEMPRHVLTGKVTKFADGYYAVETDGPVHLQVLYLTPMQVGGARVGDLVRLTYRSSSSSGLWFATVINQDPS